MIPPLCKKRNIKLKDVLLRIFYVYYIILLAILRGSLALPSFMTDKNYFKADSSRYISCTAVTNYLSSDFVKGLLKFSITYLKISRAYLRISKNLN